MSMKLHFSVSFWQPEEIDLGMRKFQAYDDPLPGYTDNSLTQITGNISYDWLYELILITNFSFVKIIIEKSSLIIEAGN